MKDDSKRSGSTAGLSSSGGWSFGVTRSPGTARQRHALLAGAARPHHALGLLRTGTLALVLLSALFLAVPQVRAAEEEGTVRLSLLVGANDGGAGREQLRYAVSDAVALRNVLIEMGGVRYEDGLLEVNPNRKALLTALQELERRARDASRRFRRVEVIFYYSGHSDAEGLLLEEERFEYTQLKKRLDEIQADVRIAILDSCYSGVFTRLKGGTRQAPFLGETGYDMKGYAFLSSSSVDEASQESDRLEGSFFTHALLAGMRGAADHNGDGRVTLNELYQFSYNETLTRTRTSHAGPQHPNYSIRMSGTGDVIMTKTEAAGSRLTLGDGIYGRVLIHRGSGTPVVEIHKEAGRSTILALAAGSYTVLYDTGEILKEAKLDLPPDTEKRLEPADFSAISYSYRRLRGDGQAAGTGAGAGAAGAGTAASVVYTDPSDYTLVSFDFSLFPIKDYEFPVVHRTQLSFIGGYTTAMDGVNAGLGVSIVEEDARFLMANGISNYVGGNAEGAQLTFFVNYIEGRSRFLQLSSVLNYVGGSAGGVQSAGLSNICRSDFRGLQNSGVFNLVQGEMRGVQFSTLNMASTVSGVQVGLVNIAGEMRGLPLGLINVSRNGGIDLHAWIDGRSIVNTGVAFRSGPVYTRFSAGLPYGAAGGDGAGGNSGEAETSLGFHFGGRITLGAFFIDTDTGMVYKSAAPFEHYDANLDSAEVRLRSVLGRKLGKRGALYAGPGVSFPVDFEEPEASGPASAFFSAGSSFSIF